MTIGERIKKLREEKGIAQAELAKAANTSKQNIYKYENGIITNIPSDKIESISRKLGVSPAYLMGWEDAIHGEEIDLTLIAYRIMKAEKIDYEVAVKKAEKIVDYFGDLLTSSIPNLYPIETQSFPLLGSVACGEPIFADEELELYVQAGTNIKADFCLRAKGDSMTGARIYDGDIVFVRRQPTVENGEIAVVLIEDEATLKRVHYDQEAGVLLLFPENPNYKTMRYSGEELNRIRILGKAIGFQGDVK